MGNESWVQDNEEYVQTEGRDLSQIRRVLIITMLLNFLASGLKMGAGLVTGALSVVADGLDSLFDGIANTLLGRIRGTTVFRGIRPRGREIRKRVIYLFG